jgi:8-amino-7-oxononanoate synthase
VEILEKCSAPEEAKAIREKGLYPGFSSIRYGRGSAAVMVGRDFSMLGSNNHLGLSYDPRVKAAASMGRVGRQT